MPQIVQAGQLNLAALQVPDLIVQIIPPQLLINGVPSNIIGFVGTATWGPKNTPVITGGYNGFTAQFGLPQPRKYDMGTAVWNATQQGAQAFRCIRVTDGTDTAASVTIQSNCLTATSLYTGTTGNQISLNIGPGSAAQSFKAVVSLGSLVPEIFDNLTYGVTTFTVTPGTYTVCPSSLLIGPPPLTALGIQAAAAPILVLNAGSSIGGTMAGYVINDIVNFPNGVSIKVNTVASGAISTFTVQNFGTVTAGQTVPTSPMAQTSTSGVGTGATLSGTWGFGQPVISQIGAGYTASTPSVTIVGGTGSGGTITAVTSPWQSIANAINLGVSNIRSPSTKITATAGVGTSAPTTQVYALAGGTDGAAPSTLGAVGVPSIVGQDVLPRTGMYAMRSALISIGVLVDVDDSTTWTTQMAFGLSEAIYMIATGPAGDNITNATTVKSTAGVDTYTMKIMFGDWCYINDPVTGATRLTSPQGFVAGLMGNQSPNQSTLNKPLAGIVATQKSSTNLQYTATDLQALASGQIDVISNPCPGGNYFGVRLGINASSNAAINGDNYTRMTYFIARTISQGMGIYVGQLQTVQERLQAKTTLMAFLANLQFLGMIGTSDGSDAFQVILDNSNNPANLVALGYQFAYVKVVYLSVIRFFIIDLEGGQTVQILNQLPTGITGTTGAFPFG